MEVCVEVLVPEGVDPLEHRDKVEALAREMCWPDPHSGACGYGPDGVTADLQWTIDNSLEWLMRVGIAAIRADFNVTTVDCFEPEECPPLPEVLQAALGLMENGNARELHYVRDGDGGGTDVIVTDREGNQVSMKEVLGDDGGP